MLERCYRLSPHSRLLAGARAGDASSAAEPAHRLVCTYPLQFHDLNASAAALLAALRPGVPLEALAGGVTPETVAFLDGLVAAGALGVDYRLVPAADPPPVEVVVPAYDDADGLGRCLAALAAQDYRADSVRVTVVDDASPRPLEGRVAVPEGLRVRWLRLASNAGPASARNAGAETPWPDAAPAPWLAFVDADCVPGPGWLAALAALLEDRAIAAAGGAVRGLRRDTSPARYQRDPLLARYEDACSSLYLGPRPGPVGAPEGALSYLPSCNLAVRREAFEAVGGFRAGWRFGEDVDLCWRLHNAGYGLFYHPQAEVAHDHRTRWGAFLARRRAYARSEATLRRVHPRRFRPLWWPAPAVALGAVGAALVTGASGWLWAAAAAVGWLVVRPLPAAWKLGAARGLGWGLAAGLRRAAAEGLAQARALNRLALVLWLPLPVLIPPLWPLCLGVGVAGAAAEWLARRPALGPGPWLVGYLAECLAYSLGRTEGLLRAALPAAGAPDAPPEAGPRTARQRRPRKG